MNPMNFVTPIYFKEDAFEDLGQYQNENVLIITSRHGLDSEAAERLYRQVAENNNVEIFNGVLPDPPRSVIKKGVEIIKSFEPTVIIGLGGGSVLDGAKGMKKEAGFNGDFIAIPTTSGTGSEVNNLAVITEDETNIKEPILDDDFQPEKAYLIPELTVSMPQKTTVDTGMDVLTHAIEAYVAKPFGPFIGYNTITDAMAEKAVVLTVNNLPKVFANPNDLEARENMLHASALASLAFIKAGLGGVHGISHKTGARLKLAHGRVNSLLLPELVQFNAGINQYASEGYEATAERFAYLASLVDLKAYDTKEGAERFVQILKDMKQTLNIEDQFSELGIESETFDNVVDDIVASALEDPCTITNPRELKTEDIKKILETLK